MKEVRIQLSRSAGFNLQEASRALNGLAAVNVARPTLFGNPFKHDDAACAVEAYDRHCQGGFQSFSMGPGKLQFAKGSHPNALHHSWPEWLRTEEPAETARQKPCLLVPAGRAMSR